MTWVFLMLFWALAASAEPPALTLSEAVAEALEKSPEVAAARRRLEQAELEEPLLLANLDPRFESAYSFTDDQSPRAAPAFQGSRSRLEHWEAGLAQKTLLGTEARFLFQNDRLANPTPFRAFDPSVDSRLTLSIRQPLLRYFWGRPDTARRRRARAVVAAAHARWKMAREQAALAAARAFLELYFSQSQILISAEGVSDARKLLAKYEEKRRYGLAEESDLLQAQASLEIQETGLLSARFQAERARIALIAALNRGDPAPVVAATPVNLPTDNLLGRSESEVLSGRPEVQAARDRRESLNWSWRVEKLDTLPDLAVTASYGAAGLGTRYGRALDDLGTFDHAVKSAGVGLSIPLGFREERLTRKQAWLSLQEAQAELEGASTAALRDWRDAREALELARRRAAAARTLADLEKKKYAAEERNFKRGRSSTDLLLRFQQDIRRAESELLRASVDEIGAALDLTRALGTLADSVSRP